MIALSWCVRESSEEEEELVDEESWEMRDGANCGRVSRVTTKDWERRDSPGRTCPVPGAG